LAFASKKFNPDDNQDDRDKIESDLEFLGLAFFENPLKSDSKSVIDELYRVHIQPVMITGDNILTAVDISN
jgi:P-type E1-E2 ATPase